MGNCRSVDSAVYPHTMPTIRPKLRRRLIRQGKWLAFLKKYRSQRRFPETLSITIEDPIDP